MKVLNRPTILLAGLLALAVCGTSVAASNSDSDAAALRTAGTAWDAAYHALDVDALMAIYSENAVLMPQSEHLVKGRAPIRKFLLAYVAKMKKAGFTPTVANVEVDVAGTLGVRSGTYVIKDKAGTTVDTGKWLEEWRKADGKWQIVGNISNSDMLPLFPPEAQFPSDPPAAPAGKK